MEGGIGWGAALALWLKANVAAQNAAASTASFFKGTMLFIFIVSFMCIVV
jgi:hypothetical protein